MQIDPTKSSAFPKQSYPSYLSNLSQFLISLGGLFEDPELAAMLSQILINYVGKDPDNVAYNLLKGLKDKIKEFAETNPSCNYKKNLNERGLEYDYPFYEFFNDIFECYRSMPFLDPTKRIEFQQLSPARIAAYITGLNNPSHGRPTEMENWFISLGTKWIFRLDMWIDNYGNNPKRKLSIQHSDSIFYKYHILELILEVAKNEELVKNLLLYYLFSFSDLSRWIAKIDRYYDTKGWTDEEIKKLSSIIHKIYNSFKGSLVHCGFPTVRQFLQKHTIIKLIDTLNSAKGTVALVYDIWLSMANNRTEVEQSQCRKIYKASLEGSIKKGFITLQTFLEECTKDHVENCFLDIVHEVLLEYQPPEDNNLTMHIWTNVIEKILAKFIPKASQLKIEPPQRHPDLVLEIPRYFQDMKFLGAQFEQLARDRENMRQVSKLLYGKTHNTKKLNANLDRFKQLWVKYLETTPNGNVPFEDKDHFIRVKASDHNIHWAVEQFLELFCIDLYKKIPILSPECRADFLKINPKDFAKAIACGTPPSNMPSIALHIFAPIRDQFNLFLYLNVFKPTEDNAVRNELLVSLESFLTKKVQTFFSKLKINIPQGAVLDFFSKRAFSLALAAISSCESIFKGILKEGVREYNIVIENDDQKAPFEHFEKEFFFPFIDKIIDDYSFSNWLNTASKGISIAFALKKYLEKLNKKTSTEKDINLIRQMMEEFLVLVITAVQGTLQEIEKNNTHNFLLVTIDELLKNFEHKSGDSGGIRDIYEQLIIALIKRIGAEAAIVSKNKKEEKKEQIRRIKKSFTQALEY